MRNLNRHLLLSISIVTSSAFPPSVQAAVSDYLPSGKQVAVACAATATLATVVGKTMYNRWVRSIEPAPINLSVPPHRQGITTLFAHGYGANNEHGTHYHSAGAIPHEQGLSTFNFDDALICNKDIFLTLRTNLAGLGDVERLQEAVQANIDQNPDAKIELFGVSRGASTILRYLSTAPQEERGHIVGAIVESPFGNYTDVVRHFPSHIRRNTQNAHWFIRYCIHSITYLVQAITHLLPAPIPGSVLSLAWPNTESFNNSPSNIIHQIPKDIPIQFICSEEDPLIPASSTEGMHDQLSKSGHNVRLLKVEKGAHGNIISHSMDNRKRYLAALREFRAQYPRGNA